MSHSANRKNQDFVTLRNSVDTQLKQKLYFSEDVQFQWFTGKSIIGIRAMEFENCLDLFQNATVKNLMQHIIVQD